MVDLVGVHLEDLLLIEAGFELVRDHDLGDLARVCLLSGVRKKPRASCWVSVEPPQLFMLLRDDVLHAALDGADVVDAGVLEEAAVFDGEHGLDHARRDVWS